MSPPPTPAARPFTLKELPRSKSRRTASKRYQQLDTPDESWEADRLGEFARFEQKRLRQCDRKMAVHAFRLGVALNFAHEKLGTAAIPYGDWGGFLTKYKLSVPTEWRYRKLAANAKTEAALAGLGLMQAYRKFGICKKQDKPKPSSDEPAPPPKEPKSLAMSLAKITSVLEPLFDEAAFADWKTESKEACLDLIQEAVATLQKISEAIRHE